MTQQNGLVIRNLPDQLDAIVLRKSLGILGSLRRSVACVRIEKDRDMAIDRTLSAPLSEALHGARDQVQWIAGSRIERLAVDPDVQLPQFRQLVQQRHVSSLAIALAADEVETTLGYPASHPMAGSAP